MFAFTILLVYAALIIVFIFGWQRIPVYKQSNPRQHPHQISVVIAIRNEEKNLPALLHCLLSQTFADYELIFVNDHSTDNSVSIIRSMQSEFQKLSIINSTGYGKKAALADGIENSTSEFVVTTDADCVFGNNWLQVISQFFEEYQSDLIICPVKMNNGNNLFENIQSLEFTSLVASSAGACGIGHPIMCNGANLAFRKSVWLKSKSALKYQLISGDDMFLLHKTKQLKGLIHYLKSEDATVCVNPSPDIQSFIKQRARWAGKSFYYTDIDTIIVALFILFFACTQIFLIFTDIQMFLLVLIAKIVTDFLFFRTIKSFFLKEMKISGLLITSVIYPVYIVSTVLFSIFRNKKTW